ncbi:MAG: class I SAM-dependent methyltransferase [Flavipsychrobacter sp.]
MSQFWNERYKENETVYGTKPNTFFKQELDKLSAGKLLLPGEGEGRNAIYAAKQGWEVTAFDGSDVAIEKALKRAADENLSFNYLHADTNGFDAEDNSFDAIALVYFHLMPEDRAMFHFNILRWLKPGGTLILEGFNPDQLGNTSGGPKNAAMLYALDMLLDDFSAFTHIDIHTDTVDLDEGPFHKGEAELIRMVATK